MAGTGTVGFMVTYMPMSVRVKRKSDQMLPQTSSLMSESLIIAAIYEKT